MGDVTRRWPRRTDLVVVGEDAVVVTQQTRARDAATAAALRAYLELAHPEADASVDVRL